MARKKTDDSRLESLETVYPRNGLLGEAESRHRFSEFPTDASKCDGIQPDSFRRFSPKLLKIPAEFWTTLER